MTQEQQNPDQNFEALQLILPPPPPLGGVYKPALIVGNLLYLSGHGPMLEDLSFIKGKVGQDLSIDEGKEAAVQTGLTMLATLKNHLGSLNKIK